MLQGDDSSNNRGRILGILDSAGAQIVFYVYDTWGKLVSITGALAATVGMYNPYRYRNKQWWRIVEQIIIISRKPLLRCQVKCL